MKSTHVKCLKVYTSVSCQNMQPYLDSGNAFEGKLHDPALQGSILMVVILSVYGADTIANDLSLSALISWFMKSIIEFLKDSNLHAIISTLLIINLHGVKKIDFAVLEEIYNNVGQQF